MKIYKKIQKSFGGSAVYLDKTILSHLGVLPGDEIILELKDNEVIMRKSELDNEKIQRLLDSNTSSKRRN